MFKTAAGTAPARTDVPLARRPSTDVMRSLANEMDRLFGDFGMRHRWPFAFLTPEREDLVWSPDVEVELREGKLLVRVDLPGMDRKDVKVELTDEALTIEGERKQTIEKEEKGYYRTERSYGRFARTIALPEGADSNSAKAEFKNGVLEVTVAVPPVAPTSARKLEIA
jgi:HSP20 family protein